MKITEKLALDAFKNDKETHISLDQKICQNCKERFCIYACPANLYSLNEKGRDGGGICRLFGMRHLPDRLYLWLCQMEIPPESIRCTISLWMMENKLTFKNAVALVRYRPETTSSAQTLESFGQGLQGISCNIPQNSPNKPKRSDGKIPIQEPQFGSKGFF